jgi:hypothetical protein
MTTTKRKKESKSRSSKSRPIRDSGAVDRWQVDVERVGGTLLVLITRNGIQIASKSYTTEGAGTPLARAFADLAFAILAGVIPEQYRPREFRGDAS